MVVSEWGYGWDIRGGRTFEEGGKGGVGRGEMEDVEGGCYGGGRHGGVMTCRN